MPLNSHTHTHTLIYKTQTLKEASDLFTKAAVVTCAVDRNPAQSMFIDIDSVLSCLVPGRTESDGCVTPGLFVPQLSSYMCFSLLL